MDPWAIFRPAYLGWKYMTRKFGVKTVLILTGVVTLVVLLYGWWDSYQ